jgi:N-acetylglucosaminyldiphosphoundecaprenol N-acetyl-beta-D-mannosaminyltransferase
MNSSTGRTGPPEDVCAVLGVPVSRLSLPKTLARLESFIAERTPRFIVTADATALVLAHDDPVFRRLLDQADLITPDGAGVVWAMRRAGAPAQDRVSGVEIAGRLIARSSETGYRVYMLGAAPGVAQMASERMRRQHPGCVIAGAHHGYFPPEDDALVAEQVAAARADVLLVGMGMPRQEMFICATRDIIRAPVAIGVGGTFDVFSGRTRRAPRSFQALRLEWLWRLLLNPRKFAKVKTLPRFVSLVLREAR